MFAETSYGYRPNKSAKDAILKVKEFAEQGYTFAVVLDLSKYFVKSKLKDLSSRKSVQSIKPSMEKIKAYARDWLNYYGIASMKNNIEDINGWLYHRNTYVYMETVEETKNED